MPVAQLPRSTPSHQRLFARIRRAAGVTVAALLLPLPAVACRDLAAYYGNPDRDWAATQTELLGFMSECLDSAEYFALLGAAQLNSGELADAVESLERALLLDPAHGAAQVDYAQAMFLIGDLFAAIELNDRLTARQDLPPGLLPVLEARAEEWGALLGQGAVTMDLLAGHDNNLNSAPEPDLITLTLSGEPVELPLRPEFRPQEGEYLNVHLGGNYARLTAEGRHDVSIEARGRISELHESDLTLLGGRYAWSNPFAQGAQWQVMAGTTHLLLGGDSIYTATDVSGRLVEPAGGNCNRYVGLASQHQLFHDRRYQDGMENKATLGIGCPVALQSGLMRFGAEMSLLANKALDARRPGGSRTGWQAAMDWRLALPLGEWRAQVSYTRTRDSESYNPLLANGAARRSDRSHLLLQYRRPVAAGTILLVNFFHQYQHSNIELFSTRDTTVEVGLGLRF